MILEATSNVFETKCGVKMSVFSFALICPLNLPTGLKASVAGGPGGADGRRTPEGFPGAGPFVITTPPPHMGREGGLQLPAAKKRLGLVPSLGGGVGLRRAPAGSQYRRMAQGGGRDEIPGIACEDDLGGMAQGRSAWHTSQTT